MVEEDTFVLRYCRFWLGHHLIHLGLYICPAGRAKDELTTVIAGWSRRVWKLTFDVKKTDA